MLLEKLKARHIPDLMTMNNGCRVITPDDWRVRRREIITLLSREEYGITPPIPEKVIADISECTCANKAVQQTIRLSFDAPYGRFSFPFTLIMPKALTKVPVFVNIAFRPNVPDLYLPAEEIIDRGFAVATFYYKDITDDSPTFDKLAALYPRHEKTGWGKIGMWAYAASRVLDYLETRSDIDPARICVTGHSRLGKTALWCGAQDERFSMVISNCSGCSGAALSRGKGGESIDSICGEFAFWFCGNYQNWRKRETEMPFDQHMLLSLIAPRKLYVSSAMEDTWADPESEFLGCLAASKAWTLQRVPGLVTPDTMPVVDEPLIEGGICYHIRTGSHCFSREDWNYHMTCRNKFHV